MFIELYKKLVAFIKLIKSKISVYAMLNWFLILYLIYSGLNKLFEPVHFIEDLNSFIKLPYELLTAISIICPLLEIALALLLLFKINIKKIVIVVAGLLIFYMFFNLYSAVNIIPSEYVYEVIVLNHESLKTFLLNLLFLIVSLIIFFIYEKDA